MPFDTEKDLDPVQLIGCVYRKSDPAILVMKAAENRL
jgi:hypothetical protein